MQKFLQKLIKVNLLSNWSTAAPQRTDCRRQNLQNISTKCYSSKATESNNWEGCQLIRYLHVRSSCLDMISGQLFAKTVIILAHKMAAVSAVDTVKLMFSWVENNNKFCTILYGLYRPIVILTIVRLKTSFSANPSHCSPFLFLLQDSLHGFLRLFTVTSEHICFLLFSFSVLTLFRCRFRAVD